MGTVAGGKTATSSSTAGRTTKSSTGVKGTSGSTGGKPAGVTAPTNNTPFQLPPDHYWWRYLRFQF
jgi:hypothetical protein